MLSTTLTKTFICNILNTKTTTNECYDCSKHKSCELFIDKLYEQDEIDYSENNIDDSLNSVEIKDTEIEDTRDPRWWMN